MERTAAPWSRALLRAALAGSMILFVAYSKDSRAFLPQPTLRAAPLRHHTAVRRPRPCGHAPTACAQRHQNTARAYANHHVQSLSRPGSALPPPRMRPATPEEFPPVPSRAAPAPARNIPRGRSLKGERAARRPLLVAHGTLAPPCCLSLLYHRCAVLSAEKEACRGHPAGGCCSCCSRKRRPSVVIETTYSSPTNAMSM